MGNPHPTNLRVNQLKESIITYHNVKPKLKAHAGFEIKSVVFCPNLYIYNSEVGRDDLIE